MIYNFCYFDSTNFNKYSFYIYKVEIRDNKYMLNFEFNLGYYENIIFKIFTKCKSC